MPSSRTPIPARASKSCAPFFSIPLGRTLLWAGLIIGTASCHCPARCHAEPATKGRADLAAILTEQGVEVAERLRAQLPAAIVRLDTGDDEQSLHELAGAAGWDRFIEDAVTVPVIVMIEAVAAGDTRLGHRVRTAFVIHVTLEKLQTGDPPNDPSVERTAQPVRIPLPGDHDVNRVGVVDIGERALKAVGDSLEGDDRSHRGRKRQQGRRGAKPPAGDVAKNEFRKTHGQKTR